MHAIVEPSLTPVSVFFLLGIAQAIFLALSLITAKNTDKKANRYLAALLVVFSLELFCEFLDNSLYGLQLLELMVIINPTDTLYGPLLWFYVRSMTGNSLTMGKLGPVWHFVPFAIVALASWALLPAAMDENLLVNHPELTQGNQIQIWLMIPWVVLASLAHIGCYLVLCLITLKSYRAKIGDTFSYHEGINLKWLWRLLLLLIGIFLLFVFRILVAPHLDIIDRSDVLLNICLVTVIYSLGYFAIRQPTIFAKSGGVESEFSQPSITQFEEAHRVSVKTDLEGHEANQPEPTEQPEANKYHKSSLTQESPARLQAQLTGYMEDAQPYLDNHLTPPQLAQALTAPHS